MSGLEYARYAEVNSLRTYLITILSPFLFEPDVATYVVTIVVYYMILIQNPEYDMVT